MIVRDDHMAVEVWQNFLPKGLGIVTVDKHVHNGLIALMARYTPTRAETIQGTFLIIVSVVLILP